MGTNRLKKTDHQISVMRMEAHAIGPMLLEHASLLLFDATTEDQALQLAPALGAEYPCAILRLCLRAEELLLQDVAGESCRLALPLPRELLAPVRPEPSVVVGACELGVVGVRHPGFMRGVQVLVGGERREDDARVDEGGSGAGDEEHDRGGGGCYEMMESEGTALELAFMAMAASRLLSRSVIVGNVEEGVEGGGPA
jgi:hypothetical protein